MHNNGFFFLATFASASVALGAVGLLVDRTRAAAIVGQSRIVARPEVPKPPATNDFMKKEYRRPVTIPFPAGNPYTIGKVVLGKMLFFDPRLSVANVLSCATCLTTRSRRDGCCG
jgi:cytochrome c peroxidase